MKLKKDIKLSSFILAAQKCAGEVLFITPDGDRLNLKSTLSQFVFSVAISSTIPLHAGDVLCALPDDYALLEEYIMPEE